LDLDLSFTRAVQDLLSAPLCVLGCILIVQVSFIHSFIHFFKINNDKMHCCYNGDTPRSKIQSNISVTIFVQ